MSSEQFLLQQNLELREQRAALTDENKRLHQAIAVLREGLERVKDGGVPCGVLANVEERMLAMCDRAREALAQADALLAAGNNGDG